MHSKLKQIAAFFFIYTFSVIGYGYLKEMHRTRPVALAKVFHGEKWFSDGRNLKPVLGAGLTADDCSKCHSQVVQEWKLSTHAHALQDLQFQAEMAKEGSPGWLCLRCHTPEQNQLKEVITHVRSHDHHLPIAKMNPDYNEQFAQESISCATCHIRYEGNRTVILGSGISRNAQSKKITAPHPVKVDADLLRNQCVNCHNVTHTFSDTLVCSFQTGDELKNGPYAASKTCADCHMPVVSRKIADGSEQKKQAHKHFFIGGGVPKSFSLFDAQLKGGYQGGLTFVTQRVTRQYKQNRESIRLNVKIKNTKAGHKIPSGDPERHVLVKVVLLGTNLRTIASKTEFIGQKWQWSPKAQKISDNRIDPLEERILNFSFGVDEKNVKKIIVKAAHIRLTPKNAGYMKKDAQKAEPEYREKIKNLEQHYPFARMIYQEEISLPAGTGKRSSLHELNEISKKMRGLGGF